MAKLRDIPLVWRKVGPWGFLKRVWFQIGDDNLFIWASALAYSWLFAIFPFLIFLLSLIPYVPEKAKSVAREEITQMVQTLPVDVQKTINPFLEEKAHELLDQRKGRLLSIGLLVTIWAAAGGMSMTMYALDKCYDIDKPRPFYIHRPLAVLLTIVVATLIISVIALVPVATIIRNLVLEFAYFESVNATLLFLFDFTRWLLALMLMFLALALVYHFGPSFRGKWVSITPGAVFCVAVWILLGFGFKFYVDRFGKYDETYGTVGGVAVLLLLMYIDAVVLLIGAEINSEIDFAVLNLPRGVEEFPREALEQDTEEEAQEVAREAVEEKEAGDSKDE